MSRRISSRVAAPKVPDPVERSPRLVRRVFGRPHGTSLVVAAAPLLLVLAALVAVLAAAAFFTPLPRPLDFILLGVALAGLAGGLAFLRWGESSGDVAVVRSLALSSARIVGFTTKTAPGANAKPRRLVVAAAPQLMVARVVPAAPVKADSRAGRVFVGGVPLAKLAPTAEAAELSRLLSEAGVAPTEGESRINVDVVVAVDDSAPDAPAPDPTFVPLSKKQSVWLVPLSALAGLVLALPDRLAADAVPTDLVRSFVESQSSDD